MSAGYRKEDAYKVLHLLEEYRDSLQPAVSSQDIALRLSLDNLIAAIRARLFTALSDLLQFYNGYLLDATRSSEEKTKFSSVLAQHWQQCSLPHVSSSFGKYPDNSSRYYDYTVSTKKLETELGISVVEGADDVKTKEQPGVYISHIAENSPAAEHEELRVGDRILEVNGVSFLAINPTQAADMLLAVRDSIYLLLRRYLVTGDVCDVELSRANGSFGFTIKGGMDNQFIKGHDGVFVSKLFSNGAAEKTSQLFPGDRIVSVNGINIEHVRHEEAVKLLSSSGDRILIKIEKRGPLAEGEEEDSVPDREVSLERGENGYGMNIVGKETPSLAVYVSQVTLGGPADVSGKIFKGDRILEVNEQDVRQVTYEVVASLFRSSHHRVKIKVRQSVEGWEEVASVANGSSDPNSSLVLNTYQDTFYLCSWFSFDPSQEPDIPDSGLPFNHNEILCVVNCTNTDWWQACRVDEAGKFGPCGLIPSEKYLLKREKTKNRSVHFPEHDSSDVDGVDAGKTNRKFLTKFRKNSKRLKQSPQSDVTDTSVSSHPFYTHMEKIEKDERRPVILLGPLKDHLNDMLVQEFSVSYAGCVPHTTRPMREGEQHGVDYYFVSVEEMERLIGEDSFIEAGRYNQNLYGTTARAVRDVLDAHRHCILSVSPQSIPRLEQAGLTPIIVLVYPTSPIALNEAMENRDIPPVDDYSRQVEVSEQIKVDMGDRISGIAKGDDIKELFYSVTTIINTYSYSVDWRPVNLDSNK